ncbi:hypothetical protein BDZ89DRAFT_1149699 [Hymenopellis radicata]|nr:hypothetical protein BDZ89DRAFT_1149699 [Hymenopellis radicata]
MSSSILSFELSLMRFLFRGFGILLVGGFGSSLYWTARSWLWQCPVRSQYPRLWDTGDPNDRQLYARQKSRLIRLWTFLRPFFASQGYHLFLPNKPSDIFSALSPVTPRAKPDHAFPFAQSYYRDDADAAFSFIAPRVWAAHDSQGREVIIKAVSGPNATSELRALRKLNSTYLRQHPHNHTIPLLHCLVFDGDVFAVMPRYKCLLISAGCNMLMWRYSWGPAGTSAFTTVGEIVHYGQAFLEAVHFLHSHGMAHGDISPQNMVMDALAPEGPRMYHYGGLRGPERRYALIDFETTLIDSAFASSVDAPGPAFERAYRQDLDQLARTLEITLRCAEDVMPEVVSLLDDMKLPNSTVTAALALTCFESIWKKLPENVLNSRVQAIRYRHGQFMYRQCEPVILSIT